MSRVISTPCMEWPPAPCRSARTRDVVEKVPEQTFRTHFGGYKMVNRIDPIACRAAKRACFFGRSMGEDFFNNVTVACRIEIRLRAPMGQITSGGRTHSNS